MEIKTMSEINEIVTRLKKLRKLGFSKKQTFKILQDLDLPFPMHMYITGNWSALGL
jgi:hypothetical protein